MSIQKHYSHLTLDDRRKIYVLTNQKKTVSEIAAYLGRHRATIYREINRNTFANEEEIYNGYFPVTAQDLAAGQRWRGFLSRGQFQPFFPAGRYLTDTGYETIIRSLVDGRVIHFH